MNSQKKHLAYRRILCVVGAVLALVMFAGPWSFTTDGLPPPEWCSPPHVLSQSRRCVGLVPRINRFTFLVSAFLGTGIGLATGQASLAGRSIELLRLMYLAGLAILILLPLLGVLLRIWDEDSPRSKLSLTTSLALGIPAARLAATPNTGEIPLLYFWGLWGYLFLAGSLLELARISQKPA